MIAFPFKDTDRPPASPDFEMFSTMKMTRHGT